MHVRTPATILMSPPVTLIDASISGNILTINPVVDMIVPNTPWLVALSFIRLVLMFYKDVPLEVKKLNSISMQGILPFFGDPLL